MDVLLTHAYYLYEDPAEREVMRPYPPLGILYIASHLRSLGVEAEVVDSTFLSPAEHRRMIREARAPVVGIYVNLMTRAHALALIDAARQSGASVVLGGPEPVNYAEEYLDHGADVIVSGEGELTITELLPVLHARGPHALESVAGVAFRDADGRVRRTVPREQITPLDDRPWPARELIDLPRYMDVWKTHHGASSVSLITARGCPYKCRWCSHSVYGFSYRHRSPEDVVDELEFIRDRYEPDQVWYADDVFTMNKRWLHRFADLLAKRGLCFPFETISREDRLDDPTIATLAQMGCYRLWVGAESGSQRILDAMERRTDAARMREVIGKLKDHGIRTGTFIMLGYEGETWSDIDATRAHLKASLPDDVLTTLAYPIKGTPYYEAVKDRLIVTDDWAHSSDRNLSVAGRYSRRFYRHARNWLGSEVSLSRELGNGKRNLLSVTRKYLRAKGHRAAMYLYRHETERATQGQQWA